MVLDNELGWNDWNDFLGGFLTCLVQGIGQRSSEALCDICASFAKCEFE